jgi:copper homeostasis protein
MQKKLLEIACFNVGSAIIAEENGADRIELCTNYWEGGVTPLERFIIEARERITIPLHVIIRLRGGDYIYSDSEYIEMENAVIFCREHGVDGVVIGALNEDFEIHKEACERMIDLAGDMNVTFHRAFDHCYDQDKAISDLISIGVKRVLTAGGQGSAFEGLKQITALQKKFGSRICIMPGGGLRSSNILQIMSSGCKEFHTSALTDNTVTANGNEIKKLKKHLLND